MSVLSEHLEKYFFNLNLDEECTELIQLMSLQDNELEERFISNPNLWERYKIPEKHKINVLTTIEDFSEPETESSEEEISYNQVRMNNAPQTVPTMPETESSEQAARRKGKRKEPTGEYWGKDSNHQGIPNSFEQNRSTAVNTINIDCIYDLEKRRITIDRWATEISLIIQSHKNDYLFAKPVMLLMEHKSEGIAKQFIKKTEWNEKTNGELLFEEIIGGFYTVFLGLDYTQNQETEIIKEQVEARNKLTNLQLCNICSLKEFTCEYEKNLYKLPQSEYPELIERFLIKIPIVGENTLQKWKETRTALTSYSFGLAIRLIQDEIKLHCDFIKKGKQLKKFNKSCCDKLITKQSNLFGCTPQYTKSYYKKRYKKKYKKTWKKKVKPFKPGKYFKKKTSEKKYIPKDKSNFCPKGKKKCRCWICSEEGHYANECPNRKQYPDKLKLIIEADHEGFQPIELPYDNEEVVFTLQLLEFNASDSNSEFNSDSE